MRPFQAIAAAAAAFIFQSCNYQHMEADLIVHNATIYTVDENWTVAEAMAVKDGKIVEIGPEREILNKYRATEKLDAQKRPVYPGFIDAHCHFLWKGRALNELDLVGTTSLASVADRLRGATPNRGEWITGRGWDQNDWPSPVYPDRQLLDSLFPDSPVYLVRIDGHAAWVNTKALSVAGITEVQEVNGGKMMAAADGSPSGILIDRAMELVEAQIPEESAEQLTKYIAETEALCFAHGLTAVMDAGLPVDIVERLMELDAAGKLRIHIYQLLSPGPKTAAFMRTGHRETPHISVRALKMFADGALGSRGAALLEPYSDDPQNSGLILNPDSDYTHWAQICKETDYQMCIHAIGDRANRKVLDLYAQFLETGNDRRWRIEHAQIVHHDDLPRFGELNVIPSVQPTHATSDAPWAAERLGMHRIQNAYTFEVLRQQLGLIALGTDFPIEAIDPLATFYAAVFRQPLGKTDQPPFQPDNALSREDALRGMTIWAAVANFEEAKRGSLKAEKAADFVILSNDVMTAPQDAFENIEVLFTFVNGEKVFEAY